jgi:hypothetical protein
MGFLWTHHNVYCHVYGWLIIRGLNWTTGFIAPYTFIQFGTTCNYSAIAILHTFQFTVPHTLGFSVISWQWIYQSHCNFKSYRKSSWHSLIPSLPLSCNCQFWRLDSTTVRYSSVLRLLTVLSYKLSARTPWKTLSSIVNDACLLARYLAMNVLL